MKRKHKTYEKPKRPYDKARIDEEAQIKKEFGLKNKKEIWKAESEINSIREKAKKLIPVSEEEQQEFFQRLRKMGLDVKSIHDVLSLDKKDYLNRRLQSIVFRKGLSNSIKEARQLIVHKKITVDGRKINRPSHIIPIELEDKIKKVKPKKTDEGKKEEKSEAEETKPESSEPSEEKNE